jgi:hypothetical protein
MQLEELGKLKTFSDFIENRNCDIPALISYTNSLRSDMV